MCRVTYSVSKQQQHPLSMALCCFLLNVTKMGSVFIKRQIELHHFQKKTQPGNLLQTKASHTTTEIKIWVPEGCTC